MDRKSLIGFVASVSAFFLILIVTLFFFSEKQNADLDQKLVKYQAIFEERLEKRIKDLNSERDSRLGVSDSSDTISLVSKDANSKDANSKKNDGIKKPFAVPGSAGDSEVLVQDHDSGEVVGSVSSSGSIGYDMPTKNEKTEDVSSQNPNSSPSDENKPLVVDEKVNSDVVGN